MNDTELRIDSWKTPYETCNLNECRKILHTFQRSQQRKRVEEREQKKKSRRKRRRGKERKRQTERKIGIEREGFINSINDINYT